MSDPIHIAVYFWPGPLPGSKSVLIGDVEISTLAFSGQKFTDSFPVSFEAALAAIEKSFGAYTEGDGSFGFSGNRSDESVWKVSGSVFESASFVNCADIWLENCDAQIMMRLLDTLGAKPEQSVIQLLEHGCFVGYNEFSKLLSAQ